MIKTIIKPSLPSTPEEELKDQSSQANFSELEPSSNIKSGEDPVPAPAPTKKFKPERIEQMNFLVKTEDDPVDDRGIVKYESCHICKWFIEKGNYFL